MTTLEITAKATATERRTIEAYYTTSINHHPSVDGG
jgi:hypothetical protein